MTSKQIISRVFFALTALTLSGSIASAQVKINEGNGVNIVMENEAIKLNIAVEGGARISSFVNKKTGKDLVTLWKGPVEDGGLLDDRNVFTSFAYRPAVMLPGGKEGVIRLTAKHPSGMEMSKTLTLRQGESTLQVHETFSNGTQKEARFMLRSFLLPGGGPRTENDQYFLPVQGQPLQALTPANNYYDKLSAPWSSVWNKTTGEGVLVAAPGIEQFYYWQGSKVFPTYEWVYPNVPAGKTISVHYALQLVNEEAPNWAQLSAALLKQLQPARFGDVAGWKNEEQRFNVNATERGRGFWLSTGNGDQKRRVPETLQIDAPLKQSRWVYASLNALKEFPAGKLQVRFRKIPAGLVQAGWQTNGVDSKTNKPFIQVLPLGEANTIELKNGTEGRLWLTLRGSDKPVEAKGSIDIILDEQTVTLPLHVKVWPVDVPKQQAVAVKDYAGLFSTIGYEVNPESNKKAASMFRAFNDMGGNVMNWTVNWASLYRYLKIADSGETLAVWLPKNKAAFQDKPVSQWPKVDFSYYDPWVKIAKEQGLTRAATYIPFSSAKKPLPAEYEWMLLNLKSYMQAHGMTGFHGKISDEISPEHLPDYIESAKIARRTGWRPGTTVTGAIARRAELINEINPYCDIWEIGFGSTEFFKNLISQRYKLEDRKVVLPADQWLNYGNGGAQDTVGMKLFKAIIPQSSAEIESLKILQDGKPLLRVGGSPWGNKKRGVFFGDSEFLYLSSFEDTQAKQSEIVVHYQVRVPSDRGETLAKVDATDEVWYYGGPANAYRALYETSSTYALKALEGQYVGFGWYDFHRWDADKIVWYDEKNDHVNVGPAYIGLKDGWDDAGLIAWVTKAKKLPVSRFISEKADAPFRMGEESQEVYRWKDVVNVTDPFIMNDARRQVLAVAVQK